MKGKQCFVLKAKTFKKIDFIVLSRYAEDGLRRPTLVHDWS